MKRVILISAIIFLLAALFLYACDRPIEEERNKTFTVTIEAVEPAYGSVDNGIVYDVSENTPIITNGNVLTIGGTTITAIASEETNQYIYLFDRWSAPEKVTADATIAAYFTRVTKNSAVKYAVFVENGTGSGEYKEGAEVTATASVPEGKIFLKWVSGKEDISFSDPYIFYAKKNITLTAVFGEESNNEETFVFPKYDYVSPDFSLENFKNTDEIFSFEYKTIKSFGGGIVEFTLWTADWGIRASEVITIDMENDTVSALGGKTENIGGWKRFAIRCSDIPVNIGEGATGEETIGLIHFNSVEKPFKMRNVRFGERRSMAVELSEPYTYKASDFCAEDFKNSNATLTFDYKSVDCVSNIGAGIEFTLWTADWSLRLTELIYIDVEKDIFENGMGSVTEIDDGWKRAEIRCSDMTVNERQAATGKECAGLLYFNTVSHVILLDNIRFIYE